MGIWVFLDSYMYVVYSLFSHVPLSFGFLVNCKMANCIGYVFDMVSSVLQYFSRIVMYL
jgi:hypothetical protein